MSGLRQVNKESFSEDADIEALIEDGNNKASSPTPLPETPRSPGAGAGERAKGSSIHNNPLLLAKAIFRKVVFTILSSNDEHYLSQRPHGKLLSLLKDIILGIILGVFLISLLVFLDHRNMIHFQSAHKFRNAAFQLLNDPETLTNLEESSEFKFITLEQYEIQRKEIDSVSYNRIRDEWQIQKLETEFEKKGEVEAAREEHKSLMSNPAFEELTKYCGGCSWHGGTTCDKRVDFLISKYGTGKIAAKLAAMSHPGCKKEG